MVKWTKKVLQHIVKKFFYKTNLLQNQYKSLDLSQKPIKLQKGAKELKRLYKNM
jgi:hypothetical protein